MFKHLKMPKKSLLWSLFFVLTFFPIISVPNPTKLKAQNTLNPVVLRKSTSSVNNNYTVKLEWNNTNLNYSGLNPEGGVMLYDVYKDGAKYGNSIFDQRANSYSQTISLTADEIKKSHYFYIIVKVTKTINGGTANSVPSNRVTVNENDFKNNSTTTPLPPQPVNNLTSPRLIINVKNDSEVTLKWDKISDFSACDANSDNGYRVYRDGSSIKKVGIGDTSYIEKLSTEMAKNKHTYYVATYCSKRAAASGTPLESTPSNRVNFIPKDGDKPAQGQSDDGVEYTPEDINPTTQASESKCKNICDKQSNGWGITASIKNAICDAQCAVIDTISGFVAILINSLLLPSLGLK